MPWIDAATLEPKLIATLQKIGIEDDSYWKEIIPDALLRAKADIVNAFASRGYAVAQIDAWDYGASFQTDLALFWALVQGGTTQNYPEGYVDKLDRRAELRGDRSAGILPPPLIINGVAVSPNPVKPPRVSGGDMVRRVVPANPPFTEPERW
jgi:hypothetical protein